MFQVVDFFPNIYYFSLRLRLHLLLWFVWLSYEKFLFIPSRKPSSCPLDINSRGSGSQAVWESREAQEGEQSQALSLGLHTWFAMNLCDQGWPRVQWAQVKEFTRNSTRVKGAHRSLEEETFLVSSNTEYSVQGKCPLAFCRWIWMAEIRRFG